MDKGKASRDEAQLASWLQQGCQGDDRAYRAFLTSVSDITRGMVRAKAGGLSAEEQEDIVQEALMAIHNKRNTWRQDKPVKPWVYAIVRYKIVDAFRARGRVQSVDIDDFADVLSVDEPEHMQGRDIEVLVDRLPPKPQTVVRCIAIDGLSIEEAAKSLGMTQTAVRVNFHRALEKLKIYASEDV